MTRRVARARAAVLAALVVLAGCGRPSRSSPTPPRDATQAAVELLRLAGPETPSREALFAVVDEASTHGRIAPLTDALALLPPSPDAVTLAESPLPEGARAVDVEVPAPAGGRIRLAVHAAPRPDGTWRVIAFSGPGVSWPPMPPPRGEGTSSSARPR